MERLTYTVPEVAELLGISRTTTYACIQRGEIPAVMLGRRLVVSRKAVDALLAPTRTDKDTTPRKELSTAEFTPGRLPDRPESLSA